MTPPAVPGAEGVPRQVRARTGLWRWLVAVLALVLLALIVSARAEERRFADLLERAQPAWLAAIVVLQLLTYTCLVHVWSRVIRRVDGKSPSQSSLVSLALAELFTDQALPSGGIGGTIFVVSALDRRGCSRAAAGAAVTVSLFGLYAAQLVAVVAALLALALEHRAGALTSSVGVVALVAAIATPIVTVAVAAGAIDRLPARLRRLAFVETLRSALDRAPRSVIFDPKTLAGAAAWRLLILALDGATLAAALVAVGHPLALQDGLAVFVLAAVAASVSLLPGGLGSYEALSIALLVALGAPLEAAAPATLLMRGFSFWLPMLPGLWFARRELRVRQASGPARLA